MSPKTSVLSIRIDNETRKMLENHADQLEMKVSLLASLILKDCSDDWVKNYVEKIAERYGVKNVKNQYTGGN
ncbi:MAG: hypothetical protein ACW981_04895 [Candidatus Hodarchaeales archaeon]|jgi:replication initiation and membrane attachment protein DnaB